MPEFTFRGRDLQGSPVHGRRTASSAEELASELSQQGITPIHINELKQHIQLINVLRQQLMGEKLPITELRLFSRQMYALSQAGVPIVTAVKRLAETTRNMLFVKILQQIVEDLSAGKTLTTSLQRFPRSFSPLFVNIVRVGENSGHLDTAFQLITQYLSLEEESVRRIKTAIRYPIFVIIAIVIAMLIINTLVIPVFANLFANFQTELPLATRFLVKTSNILIHYWPLLLSAITLFCLLIYLYIRTERGRLLWHRYQLKLPIVGWLLKRILLARFARTFSLAIQAGLPALDSLQLITSAMGNTHMSQQLKNMHESISRGTTISQAATETELFSPLVLQMLALGEETGNISDMLLDVASFYEREIDYDLQKLNEHIEPLLLLAIAGLVMMLALGVFLPMWNMVDFARGI